MVTSFSRLCRMLFRIVSIKFRTVFFPVFFLPEGLRHACLPETDFVYVWFNFWWGAVISGSVSRPDSSQASSHGFAFYSSTLWQNGQQAKSHKNVSTELRSE